MPKRKRGITGDVASRGRQLENVKGELLKLKKKEAADCQLWHNVARTEERKKQKNKEIADCQTWHNMGRREEPRKQKNKEIDDWQKWDNVARREEPKKQKNKEKRIRFGENVTFMLATTYVKKLNRRRAYEN
ncbi:hypothetical protein AVEN_201201-1 [Araneus ventricosus]|uniref:Uncharacterized protein n=1 Tax=Araneus ventricosus TaxID=182803 RepID=A0A4Y2URP1_ARAVE|nr:hypothetical protein AVEN_201201-1 [Araneus ventricosus]